MGAEIKWPEVTEAQRKVGCTIFAQAPDDWEFLGAEVLPKAEVVQQNWRAPDKGEFQIYLGRRCTYESVRKAYPELGEDPYATAS